MTASMGEADTIVRHPDLFDSLVAGARDPVSTRANRAEIRALLLPRGIRARMRLTGDELRRLAVPTLMIWATAIPSYRRSKRVWVVDLMPQSRLEVLRAGHVPQLGHPERVAERIEDFVNAT